MATITQRYFGEHTLINPENDYFKGYIERITEYPDYTAWLWPSS